MFFFAYTINVTLFGILNCYEWFQLSSSIIDFNIVNQGSAEVIFARRSDALSAFKRYNNVQLDGKAMKIEIIGENNGLPVTARVNVVGISQGAEKRTVSMMYGKSYFF